MRFPSRPSARGFSLIELMVVVVIVGILAAIAYPAYTSFITRSRRADAMAVLTAIVQAQERYRSNRHSYASTADELKVDVSAISKLYQIDIAGVDGSESLATGYVATASVVSKGLQSNDKDCSKLAVKLDGSILTYLASSNADADTHLICWAR